MVLTFKSTGKDEIYLVQKDSDGAKRIVRAVQSDANSRVWNVQLEHPSGVRPCATAHGSRGEVAVALSHYLHNTENEWQQEKARGHRPAASPISDRHVRVDDTGRTIGSPNITSYGR